MNKGFINIIVILVISAMTSLGIINYMPMSWLYKTNGNLGAVTDLATTDSLSDFPTTYNANLAQLMRVSTTTNAAITSMTALTTAGSLVTVGALSSGSLTTGFTAVPVALGGTGTTSPTSKQLMIGNGASGFQVVGFGSSAQYLTSQGDATLPHWTTSSIDETIDYNFTSSYFGIANLYASSTSLFGTTTNTVTGINASGDVYIDDGGLGIGIATTTDDVLEVAGNTLIGGDISVVGSQYGGRLAYTASSTAGNISANTTFTGSIPTNANFGIGEYAITDGLIQNGCITIARVGMTAPTVSYAGVNTTNDGAYTFTWSGANLAITEDVDEGGDSSISFTIYWYK